MEIKKEWYDAILKRTSRRSYKNTDINADNMNSIEKLISEINGESNLNIQFIRHGEEAFKSFKSSYGMITGAKSFIALVGNGSIKNVENKIGYYGELLVLEATKLGLGTCWLGGTYDKQAVKNVININENENMYCIIAVGNVKENKNLKEKLISSFSKNRKPFDKVLISKDGDIPAWVKTGIEAVIMAPSAINRQPWSYSYENHEVKVFPEKDSKGSVNIDIGISMAHFQIGAEKENFNGKWEYGDKENTFTIK